MTIKLNLFVETKEIAVIKVIDSEDSNRLADQLTEARLMLQLKSHANIVRCISCFVEGESKICIM